MRTISNIFNFYLLKIFIFFSIVLFVTFLYSFNFYEKQFHKNIVINKKNILESIIVSQISNNIISRDMYLYQHAENKNLNSVSFKEKISLLPECESIEKIIECRNEEEIKIYQPLFFKERKVGYIYYKTSYSGNRNLEIIYLIVLVLFLNFIITILGINFFVKKPMSKELNLLISNIEKQNEIETDIVEYNIIFQKTIKYRKQIELMENEKLKSRIKEIEFNVNRQLAHDIRSPLSALDMSVKSLDAVEPSQKQLIRSAINRIHDIANNLAGKSETLENNNAVESSLLSSVLSQIISEKRTEYRNLNNIIIDFPFSIREYGLFSNISSFELKRIISNLINNSIEANNKDEGHVEVRLQNTESINQIIITDNGKGITKENIEKIFDEGVSIDKAEGTGLGLHHAKSVIESWDGSITCKSELGAGTSFIISLPKALESKDFVKEINLDPSLDVVIVDDDFSIHQVWKGRLESLNFSIDNISMFSDPEKFLSWYKDNKSEDTTYLFDYEFLGHDLNGLTLMDTVAADKKYLVTSRYEEAHIKEKCQKESIGLIDKGMIGFIPINLINNSKKSKHVLIDDDQLIHMSWKMEAKASDIELDCYFTVDEFLANSDIYSKNSIVNIDSNLSDGVKGEVESKKIYDAGFENIYLTTGYAPSEFKKPNWIKKIIGKRAKFKKD